MLKKGKLGKKVWYQGELWDVDQVLSPNREQDFLLVSQVRDDAVNEDGSPVVHMAMIEVANDACYPNTREVRKIMKQEKEFMNALLTHRAKLSEAWLSLIEDPVEDFS